MGDVVFVSIVVLFFAVAVLYVRACAGIVGGEAIESIVEVEEDEAVSA